MKHVLFVMKLRDDEKQRLTKIPGYQFTFAEDWNLPEEVFKETEIILGNPRMDVLKKFAKAEWLQLLSAGANQYKDIDQEILLTNAYDVFGEAISEYMIACAFAVEKVLPGYLGQQKERLWTRLDQPRLISGSKVLSVGMGSIGGTFLKKMNLLGAECYGVRRTVHDTPDYVKGLYSFTDLDQILPEADIVALSLPETPETVHMFNEERMRTMKKDSILINVGRGSAIDTEALLKLAREGWFRGVYLDVTDPEPLPLNHPLWNTERVYITPHISGGSDSNIIRGRLLDIVSENLKLVSEGKKPLHIVDRKLGY